MSMIGNYVRLSPEKFVELLKDPSLVPDFLYPDGEDLVDPAMHLDIDKTWHAIHFLLNGQTWSGNPPLSYVVLGGCELGEEDVGYGPARYLLPDEVKKAAAALLNISSTDLLGKYNPELMNKSEIYPQFWNNDPSLMDYISENYILVVNFFLAAADAGDVILIYLN